MSPDLVTQLARDAIEVTLYLSLPILGIGLVVGLLVSLFQAVTQIQEATLTFVPKMIVIFGSLAALGPWLGSSLLSFTRICFEEFPKFIN